jgi:hypothetical protein
LHQHQWFLISQGPAQILATNNVTPTRLIVDNGGNANGGYWYVGPYDSTNGTVSKGFIVQHN